jgi:hypothetical protein
MSNPIGRNNIELHVVFGAYRYDPIWLTPTYSLMRGS